MPRQGSPPSSLRVPLSSAAQTGLRFSVASEALTEDQRRASERGVKEFALQADGETPWEVESDHRQTEVLMRSVRGGITPRQQPDQPMTTASRPQGQPLDDWALQAAEDAGNDENPFVQTGANVALRQCCCTSLVATARSFSQLDWFPKCTSGEGLAPEHHGDALARTESISERSRCNIKREQLYTICSGRWSRASDRSRLGWIVWWLNVMAVTGVALIVVVGTMPCVDIPDWAKTTDGNEQMQERIANGSMRVHDNGCSKVFQISELTCMIWFTLQYCFRALTATAAERRSYDTEKERVQGGRTRENYKFCQGWVCKRANQLDLFVIVTFWAAWVLRKINGDSMKQVSNGLFVARMLLVVRVFRVGDLYRASRIFVDGMRRSRQAIFVLLNVGFILMVLAGALLYIVEGSHGSTREPCTGPALRWEPGCRFESIPQTFWFASSLLSVQGVGDDAIPQTIPGRFAGVALMVAGMILLSYATLTVGTQFEMAFRRFRAKETTREKLARIVQGEERKAMSEIVSQVQMFDRKFAEHLSQQNIVDDEDKITGGFLEFLHDQWAMQEETDDPPSTLVLYHAVQDLEHKTGVIERMLDEQMNVIDNIRRTVNSIPNVSQQASGLSMTRRRQIRIRNPNLLKGNIRGSSNEGHFYLVAAPNSHALVQSLERHLEQKGLIAHSADEEATLEDRVHTLTQCDVVVFCATNLMVRYGREMRSYLFDERDIRDVQIEMRAAFKTGKPIVVLRDTQAQGYSTLTQNLQTLDTDERQRRQEEQTLSEAQLNWLTDPRRPCARVITGQLLETAVKSLAKIHEGVLNVATVRQEISTGDPSSNDEFIPLDQREYDFFISHAQKTGGDQCRALHLMLEAENKAVWYDQDAEDLSKNGMKNGVRNARNVLIFLSDGVMGSKWCRMEMRWGKQFGCGFVGVIEKDERHNAADYEKEKRLAPSDLRHLLEDYEFREYRRRKSEAETMIADIIRSGEAAPTRHPPGEIVEKQWVELDTAPIDCEHMCKVAVPPEELREVM